MSKVKILRLSRPRVRRRVVQIMSFELTGSQSYPERCKTCMSFLVRELSHTSPTLERRRILSLSVILIFSIVVFGGWSVVNMRSGFDGPLDRHWDLGIIQFAQAIHYTFCLLLCLLFILKPLTFLRTSLSLEIVVNLWSVGSYVALLLAQYFEQASTAMGSFNVPIVIISGVVVTYSRRWGVILFWFFATVASTLATLAWELLDPEMVMASLERYMSDLATGSPVSTLAIYTCVFLPPFVLFGSFLYVAINREKEQAMVIDTARAISMLSFDSPLVQKLLRKQHEECSQTELVLKETIENMRQYSRFLPEHFRQSIMGGNTSGIEGEEEEAEEFTEPSSSTTGVSTESNRTENDEDLDEDSEDMTSEGTAGTEDDDTTTDTQTARTDGSNSARGSQRRRRRRRRRGQRSISSLQNTAAFSSGFKLREATILVCSVRSLESSLFRNSSNTTNDVVPSSLSLSTINGKVLANFNCICETLSQLARVYRGSFDSIHGNKIVFTFNSVQNCVTHQRNAMLTAWKLILKLQTRGFQPHDDVALDVLISISSSEVGIGHVGGSSFRRMMTLGKSFHFAGMMDQMLWIRPLSDERKSGIYVDESILQEVRYEFDFKVVSLVNRTLSSSSSSKESGGLIKVYRCCGLMHKVNTAAAGNASPVEWLYEIGAQCDSLGPLSDAQRFRGKWNMVWSQAEEGKETEIETAIREMLEESERGALQRSDVDDALQLVRAAEERQKRFILEYWEP